MSYPHPRQPTVRVFNRKASEWSSMKIQRNLTRSSAALLKKRARAPAFIRSRSAMFIYELSSPEVAHGPSLLIASKRMVKHENPEKFNAFVTARRKRIGNQIDAATIFARADFVNML